MEVSKGGDGIEGSSFFSLVLSGVADTGRFETPEGRFDGRLVTYCGSTPSVSVMAGSDSNDDYDYSAGRIVVDELK